MNKHVQSKVSCQACLILQNKENSLKVNPKSFFVIYFRSDFKTVQSGTEKPIMNWKGFGREWQWRSRGNIRRSPGMNVEIHDNFRRVCRCLNRDMEHSPNISLQRVYYTDGFAGSYIYLLRAYWIHLAQDMVHAKSIVNLLVSWKMGNILMCQ
jgi:hypothetical protein